MKKVVCSLPVCLFIVFFVIGCCNDPQAPSGDISLIATPYVNKSDMETTLGTFSATHPGLDLFPLADADLKPFQASAPGRVYSIDLFYNDTPGVYQVNVMITHDSVYAISYAFEPCSADSADGDIQMSLITVSEGQMVNAGDEIGKLHVVAGHSSHIHFGLHQNWALICPYPYFETAVREDILSLSLDGTMCDCHP